MGKGRSDPQRIDRIRLAGIGAVKARAAADGVKPEKIKRDFAVIGTVAISNLNQAAQRHRLHRRTVEQILEKYEGYALEIMEEVAEDG